MLTKFDEETEMKENHLEGMSVSGNAKINHLKQFGKTCTG
jgi:hypothetical protein